MGLYIDIALIAIFAGIIIFNFIRGFIKALYPFRKWAALAIAWMVKAPVADAISGFFNLEALKQNIYDRSYAMWGDLINNVAGSTAMDATAPETYNGIFGFLGNILPGIQELCANAVRDGITDVAHTASVFVSENLTICILQGVAVIGMAIILFFALTIALKIIEAICKKKGVLGGINRVLGGIVGLFSGMIVVWGVSVIVYLIMPEFLEGTQFATWMAKSFFLSKFFGIG